MNKLLWYLVFCVKCIIVLYILLIRQWFFFRNLQTNLLKAMFRLLTISLPKLWTLCTCYNVYVLKHKRQKPLLSSIQTYLNIWRQILEKVGMKCIMSINVSEHNSLYKCMLLGLYTNIDDKRKTWRLLSVMLLKARNLKLQCENLRRQDLKKYHEC